MLLGFTVLVIVEKAIRLAETGPSKRMSLRNSRLGEAITYFTHRHQSFRVVYSAAKLS